MVLKRISTLLLIAFLLYCLKTKAAPAISNFAYITNTCSATSKTFSVNIYDIAGIASGSLTPRVYYRKNLGSYISTTGTLTTGTFTNGVWTFNMTYTVTGGDFIYFYVVAQNTLSNVSAYPSEGFSGLDVNTVITDAYDPLGFYYGLLNGTYTVGTGGSFTRLKDAAIAYSSHCATMLGPVTFILTDTAYKPSTGEVFPIVFGDRWEASATNSLLIKPATGTNVNITGYTNSTSVIKFLNAKYFTFDGNNGGGNGITVRSAYTGTMANASILIAGSSTTAQGCKNGTINQIDVYGGFAFNGRPGIFIGTNSPSYTGANNDSITISNNHVLRSDIGIFAVGSGTSITMEGLSINSNTVGPTLSSSTSSITNIGIHVVYAKGLSITKNLVQNCGQEGLYLAVTNTMSVTDNTIRAINGSSSWFARGMWIDILNFTGVIRNNFIYDINNLNPGYGAQGMYVNAGQYCGLKIENNMISDIRSHSALSYTSWPVGIYLDGTGNIDIDNNSINLYGSHTSTTGLAGSTALLVTGLGSIANYNIKLRDNIFCNTYDNNSTLIDTSYSVYSTVTTSNFTFPDYNNYYVGGTGNIPMLAFKQGVNLPNLSSLQSSFGANMNSFNVAPVFVAPNDLHLITSSNPFLDNTATPISGITTDIDNQTRSVTFPDIGADEFINTSPCTTPAYGSISTTSYSFCSGLTAILNFNGIGSGTGLTYQWKVSTTPSGPYSNVIGGFGANTTSYTTAPLSGGVYYYVLERTCSSASINAISNEATVTVNFSPSPSAFITCKDTLCAGDSLVLTGGTDIGTSFNWFGPSGFNSTLQSTTLYTMLPSQSGIYSFTASTGTCSTTASVSVFVYPPIQPTVAASPSPVCPNASCTLTAIGAVTYTWNTFSSFVPSPSVAITATNNGVWYTVLVTDSNGCLNSNQVQVIWKPIPVITSASSTICVGQSATLSILGSPITYTWVPPASGLTITVTPTATASYSVYGTSTSGCNFFTAYPLYVDPIPTFSISTSNSISCIGQAVTLTASGASSYNWTPINYTGSVLTFSPLANYSFTVSGYNSNASCFSTVLFTQTVTSCTGFSENLIPQQSITILPNPNNGNFVLLVDKGIEQRELVIYNNLGQEIYKKIISDERNEIKLENIASGLYYLKLKVNNSQSYICKFVLD